MSVDGYSVATVGTLEEPFYPRPVSPAFLPAPAILATPVVHLSHGPIFIMQVIIQKYP